MAFPEIETLEAIVDQPKISKAAFAAKLTALMGNADAVKQNYRGAGLYAFYVDAQIEDKDAEELVRDLKADGYKVQLYTNVQGFMPPPHMHDFRAADYTVEGVTGFPRFAWTHIQISKLPTP